MFWFVILGVVAVVAIIGYAFIRGAYDGYYEDEVDEPVPTGDNISDRLPQTADYDVVEELFFLEESDIEGIVDDRVDQMTDGAATADGSVRDKLEDAADGLPRGWFKNESS